MEANQLALLVMAFCIVLFMLPRISMAVSGVLGCLLMVLLGVCSFEEAFSGFSNSIIVLLISAMVVGTAMRRTGLAAKIGRQIIRWSNRREKLFLFVCCLVAGLMSTFLANTATIASMIPIVESVCRATPEMKRKNLILPIALAVTLGGASTLIGSTPQLTANGVLQSLTGQSMTMWTLTAPGFLLFGLFLLWLLLFGYRSGCRIWGEREETAMQVDTEEAAMPHAKLRQGVLAVILLLMIASYCVSLLTPAETALCAALACLLTGCCSVKEAVRETQWETVIFLGSVMGLSNAITLAGTEELVSDLAVQLLGTATSPYLIFAVLVVITLLISQVLSNSSAIMTMLPIAVSLCETYGFAVMPYCVGITLAASVSCCTPMTASQIAMTQVAGYRFSDYFRYGWKLSLLFLVGILLFVPLLYPF